MGMNTLGKITSGVMLVAGLFASNKSLAQAGSGGETTWKAAPTTRTIEYADKRQINAVHSNNHKYGLVFHYNRGQGNYAVDVNATLLRDQKLDNLLLSVETQRGKGPIPGQNNDVIEIEQFESDGIGSETAYIKMRIKSYPGQASQKSALYLSSAVGDLGYSDIVIEGNFPMVIYDEDGKPVADMDNAVKSMKRDAGTVPMMIKFSSYPQLFTTDQSGIHEGNVRLPKNSPGY